MPIDNRRGDARPLHSGPRRRRQRWLLLALLAAPAAAWAFAKPARLLAPQWLGHACRDGVCVEDAGRLDEALALYDAALADVGAKLGAFDGRPRLVFCTTRRCYESFGGGAERAITYPRLGSLVAPDAWAPHFVRHELIHARQAQEMGVVRMLRAPAWFREGMAYSLSEPPAGDMPAQFLAWRDEYQAWAAARPQGAPWSAAHDLQESP
jgi:hypothetical protein